MQPPRLEYLFTIRAELDEIVAIGAMRRGERRYVPISGGEVSGPSLRGVVLPLGGDSQVVVSDSLIEVSAHYFIRSADGIGISVFNQGVRRASAAVAQRLAQGEAVPATEYYFRSAPSFEAPAGSPYAWLNDSLFIASAEREPRRAIIHVHRVT